MGWTGWLLIGTAILSLYLLGLVCYRLYLNVKSLKAELSRSEALAVQLQQFEAIEIEPAKPHDQTDLAKVLLNRRSFERDRAQKREARQRRLVQRISEIEIDKRYQ